MGVTNSIGSCAINIATVQACGNSSCNKPHYLKKSLAQSADLAAGLRDFVVGRSVCKLPMLTGRHVGT